MKLSEYITRLEAVIDSYRDDKSEIAAHRVSCYRNCIRIAREITEVDM